MSNLKGIPGELRATIHITRKATGKVDTVEIVGHSDPTKLKEILERDRAREGESSTDNTEKGASK